MTPDHPLRVVFDTMVFLQALASNRGAAFRALQTFYAGQFQLFVSRASLAEVRDVLSRPAVRKKNPEITDERLEALLLLLSARAIVVDDVVRRFEYARDPDDEPLINLALQSRAHYLVSWDRDLLDLMDESQPEGHAFRQQYPDLTILTPPALLRHLRSDEQEAETAAAP